LPNSYQYFERKVESILARGTRFQDLATGRLNSLKFYGIVIRGKYLQFDLLGGLHPIQTLRERKFSMKRTKKMLYFIGQ
jgi:hypothetical protein